MLFRKQQLIGLRQGTVSLAFRRWKRPTVKSGGTLLTPVGQLRIGAISRIKNDEITADEAKKAGYKTLTDLLDELSKHRTGDLYRIELGSLSEDPRIKLRNTPATGSELEDLQTKLQRLDKRAKGGPWTYRVLELLKSHPEVRAGDLCGLVGLEKETFKRDVRKLKNLGLTQSLEIGYCLSPRGEHLLGELRETPPPTASTSQTPTPAEK